MNKLLLYNKVKVKKDIKESSLQMFQRFHCLL